MLLAVVFALLLIATFSREEARRLARHKAWRDWLVDLLGLTVQGTIVPVLQLTAGWALLSWAAPDLQGSVRLPPLFAFLLSFVVVDYLYYWNHRLLHTRWLWPAHQVHHSATAMDVFATSRNTLWTSALIVYLWLHGLGLYLLADPAPFAAGATLTAALDLWRHSPLQPPAWLAAVLEPWLILPADHARHHASDVPMGNYAANLKLWDRLHGTCLDGTAPGRELGRSTGLDLGRTLLWPFP